MPNFILVHIGNSREGQFHWLYRQVILRDLFILSILHQAYGLRSAAYYVAVWLSAQVLDMIHLRRIEQLDANEGHHA